MAEMKGRFIQLAYTLMAAYPDAQKKAAENLRSTTGAAPEAMDPEGWYDTKILDEVLQIYAKASVSGKLAMVTVGKKIYPTIKKAGGIPDSIKTPLDLLKFEAEGYKANHRGADVKPRRFLVTKDKEVVVEAPAPGYDEKLYEGVFLGILEMFDIRTGKVEVLPNSTFKITW